ncbi:putative chromosome segregation protein [Eremomyces bilateralis CBS 781.70]|uniref:Chromosome segregation protein n=1 Tax=Eremomyces bilateralis CBS 781.70 TaxID=1392243 RepID=A0A6G1FW22_9PEZI|nr:putative chromosome segregation protein [Eremomyces bilateralis CBS 781.70]KAF1810105.1 putative chromosome segregation protein [Eremomyces bilateralis CBS 781.70]
MANPGRLRGRPAHTPGPTYLSYTPNGRHLVTVGLNNAIRIFQSGSDSEPTNIDNCQESNFAVAAANGFFITGSEDGTVSKYSMQSNTLEEVLVRCTLPVRDVALSPDHQWVAVASDELVVKVVNTEDMTRVLYLREQSKGSKHVSFDPSGTCLAVSCSDGIIYIYSMSSEEPQLVKKVDGVVKSFETDSESSAAVLWHPDGRAFAAPTGTRDIQVVSQEDWANQKVFSNGHTGNITALAWSPNGAFLATSGADRKLILWDALKQTVAHVYDDIPATILALKWHPGENILSYTTNEGELFIRPNFVPSELSFALREGIKPAPLLHDTLGGAKQNGINGTKPNAGPPRRRDGTPDTLDEIMGSDLGSDLGSDVGSLNGFIDDDDGAGYTEGLNGHGKRTNSHLDPVDTNRPKKRYGGYGGYGGFEIQHHEAFQPGSTSWRGNRRYLCLNLIGFIWTVDQGTHNTVTVEFYDREFHRDFHFTDPFLYDKACLTEHGALFACPPSATQPSTIHYRPHETWTARTDWRTPLPAGEHVTSIALSDAYVVATTSDHYVRIYSLFGVPLRVYKQKSSPAVTCAAWRNYVMTIGNGPPRADGFCSLLYSIENVKRDEVCQMEDIVAVDEHAKLQSVFFSDSGDPCIYTSNGLLLTLLHWRLPNQARWTPLLDTTHLPRLASGLKDETYWPVAVAHEKFHCIILKGGERSPYFPRPLLSEFEFSVPLSTRPKAKTAGGADGEEEPDVDEAAHLEQQFVKNSILLSLLDDMLSATRATSSQRAELGRRENEVDKAVLQLVAVECRTGEERGMKALELAGLLRDRSGRMMEAAEKIAGRYGRDGLGERIRGLTERRLVGWEEEEG